MSCMLLAKEFDAWQVAMWEVKTHDVEHEPADDAMSMLAQLSEVEVCDLVKDAMAWGCSSRWAPYTNPPVSNC